MSPLNKQTNEQKKHINFILVSVLRVCVCFIHGQLINRCNENKEKNKKRKKENV